MKQYLEANNKICDEAFTFPKASVCADVLCRWHKSMSITGRSSDLGSSRLFAFPTQITEQWLPFGLNRRSPLQRRNRAGISPASLLILFSRTDNLQRILKNVCKQFFTKQIYSIFSYHAKKIVNWIIVRIYFKKLIHFYTYRIFRQG